jgi:hypothetical protein
VKCDRTQDSVVAKVIRDQNSAFNFENNRVKKPHLPGLES